MQQTRSSVFTKLSQSDFGTLSVVTETIVTLLVAALVPAPAAVVLVEVQVDAAPAAAITAAALAHLVAAAAVVRAGHGVDALAAAARRPWAPPLEADGGRLLGAVVDGQGVGRQEPAPPGRKPRLAGGGDRWHDDDGGERHYEKHGEASHDAIGFLFWPAVPALLRKNLREGIGELLSGGKGKLIYI